MRVRKASGERPVRRRKVASEVTRMSKAGGGGDVGNGHASVAEQHGSAVKLPSKDIARVAAGRWCGETHARNGTD